jgi:hypothetical protein
VATLTAQPAQQHAPTTRPGVDAVRLFFFPLLVLAGATVVGVLLGFVAYALLDPDSSEGFEALGDAILALAFALLVAVVLTVVGLVVLARHLFLPGHRAAPLLLALVAPPALVALLAAFAGVLPDDATVILSALSPVLLVVPSLVFMWWGSAAPTRSRLSRGAGAVAAVAVVGSLLLYVVSDAREDQVADDLPLVLFDGTTAEAPFTGWTRDRFTTTVIRPESAFAPAGHEAYLKYLTPTGVAFMTMRTEVGDCSPTPVRSYTCQVIGSVPAGELRSYRTNETYPSFPDSPEFVVLVYDDGSGVSVNTEGTDMPAQDVLARLERVDRDAFEDATGVGMDLRD